MAANTTPETKETLLQERKVSSLDGLAQLGKNYFQSLFKADSRSSIAKIVRVAGYFPLFVDDEENRALMEEVSDEELKEVLCSFQKGKSLRIDGWPIEFFLGLYNWIGPNILKVEESRREGHMHAPLNTTFNALNSKIKHPSVL